MFFFFFSTSCTVGVRSSTCTFRGLVQLCTSPPPRYKNDTEKKKNHVARKAGKRPTHEFSHAGPVSVGGTTRKKIHTSPRPITSDFWRTIVSRSSYTQKIPWLLRGYRTKNVCRKRYTRLKYTPAVRSTRNSSQLNSSLQAVCVILRSRVLLLCVSSLRM